MERLKVPAGESTESLTAQLMQDPTIELVEPNFIIKHDQLSSGSGDVVPDDSQFTGQWALRNTGQAGGQFGSDIGVTKVWQTTTGLQSTIIAVIDSGIDFGHPDLANNRWTNTAVGPGR